MYSKVSEFISCLSFILVDKLQQKTFKLIGSAYTSIKVDDFVVYMGMSTDEAVEGKAVALLSLISFISITIY